jgi:DNA end-binding protein Ku
VVLRSKQQLCALRPTGEALTLSTMLFGDEVLSPDRLDELESVNEAEASERELTMAQQLIDSLSSDFEPEKYHDEYRERVLNLIERKAAGEEIAIQPQAEEPAAAPDLMAALEASLAAVGEDSEPKPKAKSSRSSDGAGSKKKTAKAKS